MVYIGYFNELNLQICGTLKNDAFVAKFVNTRLTKNFMAIFAPDQGCQVLPPCRNHCAFLNHGVQIFLWKLCKCPRASPVVLNRATSISVNRGSNFLPTSLYSREVRPSVLNLWTGNVYLSWWKESSRVWLLKIHPTTDLLSLVLSNEKRILFGFSGECFNIRYLAIPHNITTTTTSGLKIC